MDDKPTATETTKTDHKTDFNVSLMTFITFISSFLNVDADFLRQDPVYFSDIYRESLSPIPDGRWQPEERSKN